MSLRTISSAFQEVCGHVKACDRVMVLAMTGIDDVSKSVLPAGPTEHHRFPFRPDMG